mgnify:CR=1 FL=1
MAAVAAARARASATGEVWAEEDLRCADDVRELCAVFVSPTTGAPLPEIVVVDRSNEPGLDVREDRL